MLNLIQNEWIKMFRQVGTYIMLGLLVLLIIGTGVITKIYDTTPEPVNDKWKEQLIEENVMWERNIEEMPLMKEYFTKSLAINNYRLETIYHRKTQAVFGPIYERVSSFY